MKMRLNQAVLVACVLSLTLIARPAFASLFAHDDASEAAYSDGWQAGDNGGTGTWGGGWTFKNQSNVDLGANNGNRGVFVASSVNNDNVAGDTNVDGDINTTGNKAWGVYSNSTDQVYAIRPLSGALNVGDSVTWYMDNGDVANGQVVGVRLMSNAADTSNASRVFEFRYVGENTSKVYSVVGSSFVDTTIGFTREGLQLDYTLTGTSTFSLKIRRLVDGLTQTITGSNVSASPIVALAFKNQFAGSGGTADAFFNNITVTPLPEASAVAFFGVAMVVTSAAAGLRRKRPVTPTS